MIHNLEYELEGGFGEEFESDSGGLESGWAEFEIDSETPAGRVYNPPVVGDRSGFRELEVDLEEEIFPPDDRLVVTDTTKVPHRFICHVLVGLKAADGTIATGKGSGTLIGNSHVLTTAHNLKQRVFNPSWPKPKVFTAQKITVIPGRNTSFSNRLKWTPFGSHVAKSFAMPAKWEKPPGKPPFPATDPAFDDQSDFALITLKTEIGKKTFSSLGGKPLGYWGSIQNGGGTLLESVDPESIRDKTVNLCGYPADKCGADPYVWPPPNPTKPGCPDPKHAGTQFGASGKVIDPMPAGEPNLIYHQVDGRWGQSGCPIWRADGLHRYLVAVYTAEDPSVRNLGMRISADVLNSLKGWGWRTS
jgi:V8-like Glu-specific endopeptidase